MSYSNENSEEEREKGRERERGKGRRVWKCLINGGAGCTLHSCGLMIQAFCNCLVNLPGQDSFEGVWIIGGMTKNLVLYVVGNCLVLFLRIICACTVYVAFMLAQ
jgi:hypothetical protein